jgi:hypothetical protein
MRLLCLAGLLLTAACNQHVPLGHENLPVDAGPPLDSLVISGQLCTSIPDPSGFPVKVVLLVEQSGGMCVFDPPGSQGASGICETALSPIAGMLPQEPARVTMMKSLFASFANNPLVSVAVVPFETNVKGVWPMVSGPGQSRFESLSGQGYADAVTRVSTLQSELGKAADYEGALAYAYGLISADVNDTQLTNPELLPRTRYEVVLIGSGMPFPRCAFDQAPDAGPWASVSMPELTWPDSPSADCSSPPLPDPECIGAACWTEGLPDAGPNCYCNGVDPMDPDLITGFTPGGERNQFNALLAYPRQMKALQAKYHVGDIRLHTVQVFDQDALNACGSVCWGLLGAYAGVPDTQRMSAALSVGTDLMQQLAAAADGTALQFSTATQLAGGSLTSLDFTSAASQNLVKTLMVRFLTSDPAGMGRVSDSDGDGVPDSSETQTDPMSADSDGDCFSDGFELRHAADGFDPNVKDARGCDPQRADTLGCSCRDTDGDGLSQFAENYLGTNPTLMDTDTDGIPDGDEVRWGLNPLSALSLDSDGDLLDDNAEILQGSDPTVADSAYRSRWPMRYDLVPHPQGNGSVCYDYTVSGPPLLDGPNAVQLFVAEAPGAVLNTDYGVWRTACVTANHTHGTVQHATVADSDHGAPTEQTGDWHSWEKPCVTAQ